MNGASVGWRVTVEVGLKPIRVHIAGVEYECNAMVMVMVMAVVNDLFELVSVGLVWLVRLGWLDLEEKKRNGKSERERKRKRKRVTFTDTIEPQPTHNGKRDI